jgi:hypothetical protein
LTTDPKPSRRTFIGAAALGIATAELSLLTPSAAWAQSPHAASTSSNRLGPLKNIKAGVLDVGYYESGPGDGTPVVLLHGFP